VDWAVFHFLNGALANDPTVADGVEDFAGLLVPLFGLATCAVWSLDRPGGRLRWRLASFSALLAAGLGLVVSQAISHAWARERPFAAHPDATHLLVAPSPDPSFPSDHAVAAFAIAFAVVLYGRRMGALFLAGATVIALSRVVVGVHYPGDVVAGALVGLACALVVVRLGDGRLEPIVGLVSRVTDPLVRPLWSAADRLGITSPRGRRTSRSA
jgi:undecaprenyl-diphosphatase